MVVYFKFILICHMWLVVKMTHLSLKIDSEKGKLLMTQPGKKKKTFIQKWLSQKRASLLGQSTPNNRYFNKSCLCLHPNNGFGKGINPFFLGLCLSDGFWKRSHYWHIIAVNRENNEILSTSAVYNKITITYCSSKKLLAP